MKKNIALSDNMTYEIYSIDIYIFCNIADSKATLKIDKPSVFKKGINNIKIIVIAEDSTLWNNNL